MATLRQYYETDFNNTVRVHVRFPVSGEDIEAVVLLDFAGYFGYLSCFVPGQGRKLDFFLTLIRELKWRTTELRLDGKVRCLPENGFTAHSRLKILPISKSQHSSGGRRIPNPKKTLSHQEDCLSIRRQTSQMTKSFGSKRLVESWAMWCNSDLIGT